jgi:putative nucleotidyltransferase with HDIG domain
MGRGSMVSVLSPGSIWSSLRRTVLLGLYVGVLTASAVALLAFLVVAQAKWPSSVSPEVFAWPGLLLFIAVGVFAERYTIRIGRGMEVSAGFLAIFLAAAIVGPIGAFVVGAISQLWLFRPREWQKGLCFVSAFAIFGGASGLLYWALVGESGTSEVVVAAIGILVGVFFQALNYAVFVPVMWLRRRIGPKAVWLEAFQPFLPFHFFFLAISLGLIFIYRNYVLAVPATTPGLLLKSTLLIIVSLLPVLGLIYAFRAYAHQRELAQYNARLAVRNERLALEAIASLVTALDVRDNYTCNHSAAVARWSVDMARIFGLSEPDMNMIHLAGLMHDVGKIVMRDDILKSPAKLDEIGRAMMQSHPRDGANILSKTMEFREVAKVVLYHHERYDGNGYPEGWAGEEIPFISRILCVADSYSAMVSDRPYRSKLSTEIAVSELVKNKGTQFDPKVVDVFLELLESHDDDYRRGDKVDFLLEFQQVKFLRERELPPDAEGEAAGAAA